MYLRKMPEAEYLIFVEGIIVVKSGFRRAREGWHFRAYKQINKSSCLIKSVTKVMTQRHELGPYFGTLISRI